MRRFAFLILVGAAVIIAVFFMTTASGSDLQGVGYEGKLEKEDGSVFDPGEYEVQFRIYKQITSGEPIWSISEGVVVGDFGEFTVYLGPIEGDHFEVDAADPNDTGDRYLEIFYESAKAMDRVLIVPVPYATSADVATTNKVTREAAEKIWETDDSLIDTLSKQMVSGSYASLAVQQIAELQYRLSEFESILDSLSRRVEFLEERTD